MEVDYDYLLNIFSNEDDSLIYELIKRKRDKYIYNSAAIKGLSHKQIDMAKSRLEVRARKFGYEIANQNPKYIKAEKIIDKNSCDGCKYSTVYESYIGVSYRASTHDEKICKSCFSWIVKLEEHKDSIVNKETETYQKNITEDVIMAKALIGKINKKIETIKQTKI